MASRNATDWARRLSAEAEEIETLVGRTLRRGPTGARSSSSSWSGLNLMQQARSASRLCNECGAFMSQQEAALLRTNADCLVGLTALHRDVLTGPDGVPEDIGRYLRQAAADFRDSARVAVRAAYRNRSAERSSVT